MQGGSNGTLEVDATDSDTWLNVIDSDSTLTTIKVSDIDNDWGLTSLGAGVAHLILRTNNVIASDYRSNGGDGTDVTVSHMYPSVSLRVETGAGTYDTVTIGSGADELTVANAVIVTGAGHDVVNVNEDGDGDAPNTAYVDFTGGSLGLGNVLNAFGIGEATIQPETGTSHTIYVDQANALDATGDHHAGTVVVASPCVIGTMEVDLGEIGGFGTALIEANSTIGTITNSGFVELTGASASTTISAFAGDGVVTVDSGAGAIVSNSSTIGTLNVSGQLALVAGGSDTLTLNPSSDTGSHLSFGPNGKLDVQDDSVIANYAGDSPKDPSGIS